MNTETRLTCDKCGNKVIKVSSEFDFDNNFVDPICSECSAPLSKEEYIRQIQNILKNTATEFLKGSGFALK